MDTLPEDALPDLVSRGPARAPALDRRRWATLVIIAVAQLTVVLDLTVVNVALPDAQKALSISDANRQWVVTSYALAFGSLLLLGGRIADYWGRKRSFIVGMLGFATASAIGGLAQNAAELFTSRALQGVFGALLAPAALSLLQVAFPTGEERTKAFAVFGAVAGGGSAVGAVIGGILTEYANWRWCLLINVPVVIIAVIAAQIVLVESRAHGNTKYDIPGATVITVGLAAIVFGCAKASTDGWTSTITLTCLAVGLTAVTAFVFIEQRSEHPLLPLHIVLHPTRGGSFLTALLAGAALLGGLLFLTFYMQITLGYSPLKAGLGSLPMTAVFVVGTRFAERMTNRFGAQTMMVSGAFIGAVGMVILTRIGLHTAFIACVLPGELVLGIGLCALFIPLSSAALIDVDEHDAGAASGMLNATQQVGSAVGAAIFSTIYASAVSSYVRHHGAVSHVQGLSQIHGYVTAFWWATAAMVVAGFTALLLIRVPKTAPQPAESPAFSTLG